jgi:hypothetical protein
LFQKSKVKSLTLVTMGGKISEQKQRQLLSAGHHDGLNNTLHIFLEGDHVQVIKEGSQFGKTGVVENPEWNGRVQIIMDEDGRDKSYVSNELMTIVHTNASHVLNSNTPGSPTRQGELTNKKKHEALLDHTIFASHYQDANAEERRDALDHWVVRQLPRARLLWDFMQCKHHKKHHHHHHHHHGEPEEYLHYIVSGTIVAMALTDDELEAHSNKTPAHEGVAQGGLVGGMRRNSTVSKQQQRINNTERTVSTITAGNFIGIDALDVFPVPKIRLLAQTDVVCLRITAAEMRKKLSVGVIKDLSKEASVRAEHWARRREQVLQIKRHREEAPTGAAVAEAEAEAAAVEREDTQSLPSRAATADVNTENHYSKRSRAFDIMLGERPQPSSSVTDEIKSMHEAARLVSSLKIRTTPAKASRLQGMRFDADPRRAPQSKNSAASSPLVNEQGGGQRYYGQTERTPYQKQMQTAASLADGVGEMSGVGEAGSTMALPSLESCRDTAPARARFGRAERQLRPMRTVRVRARRQNPLSPGNDHHSALGARPTSSSGFLSSSSPKSLVALPAGRTGGSTSGIGLGPSPSKRPGSSCSYQDRVRPYSPGAFLRRKRVAGGRFGNASPNSRPASSSGESNTNLLSSLFRWYGEGGMPLSASKSLELRQPYKEGQSQEQSQQPPRRVLPVWEEQERLWQIRQNEERVEDEAGMRRASAMGEERMQMLETEILETMEAEEAKAAGGAGGKMGEGKERGGAAGVGDIGEEGSDPAKGVDGGVIEIMENKARDEVPFRPLSAVRVRRVAASGETTESNVEVQGSSPASSQREL